MASQAPPSSAASVTKPTILLLSLDKANFWDEQYAALIDLISSKATIKRVTKIPGAVTYLTNNTPSAIIITDPALTVSNAKYDAIREKTASYVREGGTAVIATHFTTFVLPTNMNRWFSETWGLPWRKGDYHGTTAQLKPNSCGGRFDRFDLPAQYSQKAVFLQNVDLGDTVYSLPAADGQQTPVAFVKVGEGFLGYVGDVNDGTECREVIMAMCGP